MSTNLPSKPAKQQPPIVAIKAYVEARRGNLSAALAGTGVNLDRFLTLALNQSLQTPALTACTPASWFDALQKCATHGLLPDGIHGALVPYKDRVTFQPMYQGLVQRAYQTGMVARIWAEVVYEGERFDVRLGADPTLVHIPDPERGDPVKLFAVYACAKVNGETHFTALFKRDVARHKAASKTANRSDSPWNTATAEMWKKTGIIALSKVLPHFHADSMKVAELVSDAEADDIRRDEAIDVVPIAEDRPPQMDAATERLRAEAPKAEPALRPRDTEPPAERQPGEDDGDTKGDVPPPECFHEEIHGRTPAPGRTIVCSKCTAALTVVQLRAAEGRYARAQEAKR